MKKLKLYFLTLFLIIIAFSISIPALTTKISDFQKKTKIYESFEIDSLKRERLFKTTYDRTLILKMSDGTKWNISKVYSKYFNELKDKKNIGKKYSFYILNDMDDYPSQVEIENKIIYDIKQNNNWNYAIIVFLIISVYLSISEFRNKKTQNKPTENE